MSKINIHGLHLEEVIHALFVNVYDKSEASKQIKNLIDSNGGVLTKDSISRFLKNNIRFDSTIQLDYLSSVQFNIKINKSILIAQKYITYLTISKVANKKAAEVIDVSFYNQVHKTKTTPNIMTAEACINALKIKAGIIDPSMIRWQRTLMNLKPQDYSNRTEPHPPRNYCVGNKIAAISPVNQTLPFVKNTLVHTVCNKVVTPLTTGETLANAALYGAGYAVLTESVGDALYLTGLVSKDSTEHVKQIGNLILLYLTGSWLSLGAGFATSKVLEKAGCSNSNALIGGQTIATAINLGQNLTPLGLASTTVSLVAGKLGLWAEKRIVDSLKIKEEPNPSFKI